MENQEVFILGASRTPMGNYGGGLSSLSAIELGIEAVRGAIQYSKIALEEFEVIVMGNVLSAGLGQAPARQVSVGASLPYSVCATTVNKVCASGMKAINIVSNDISLGTYSLGIAGGMESMSSVSYYIPKARFGLGYGDGKMMDGLALDGLTDAYSHNPMGVSGDLTAKKYQISRLVQDDFAELSYTRAREAWENGNFLNQIIPIIISQKKGEPLFIREDEAFRKANFEKMRQLKPIFSPEGTVTAANASPISDGASALVLAGGEYLKRDSLRPSFKIIAYAEAEGEPDYFTTAPILATQKVLKKAGLRLQEIDFFEVNEAFAVVPLVYMKILDLPPSIVNIYGGAIALGHPLGSSGSRIVINLMDILKQKNKRLGLATICNGGGGASALIIEKI